ncbi:PAS domain S-box protein [Rhodoferax sp. GW822-FHT02A01]|uniref:PAS domain S-box protein n=1 Tax=Rhodoferax sp. GW822-FHT02A01 TaxID=3141537 RepID=UPI00315C92D1
MVAFLLAGMLTVFWTFKQMEEAARGRGDSAEVLTNANHFLANLNNAESGQRGYILTGEASYLQSYSSAVAALPLDVQALQAGVQQAAPLAHLSAMAPVLQAKLLELAESIAARQRHDLKTAMLIVETGRGQVLMDAIRAEMGALIQFENTAFQQFDAAYQVRLRNLYICIVLTGVVAILYALFFVYSLLRNERQRLGDLLHTEARSQLQIQSTTNAQLLLANAALRESEEKLAVTLASIGDAMIATDAAGAITRLNPTAQTLTGWTQEDALGHPIAEVFCIVNKNTRATVESPVSRALTQGAIQALTNHTVLIARDGREFDIADSCAPIRDAGNAVVGAVLVFRNVTQEHAVQQALVDSSALVQAIFNTAMDGILTIHEQGAILESVNPAIERMFGYSAAELEGKRLDLLVPELESGDQNTLFNYKGAGGEADHRTEYEVLGRRKDGSVFLLEIALSKMVLRGQHFFAGVLRDISARKQAEEALRQNSTLQSAIFNSANFSSIATDANGVIQIFNVGAERMLGYSAADVLDKITPAEISDPQEIKDRAQTLSAELGVSIQPGFEALVFKASRGIEDIYELTYIRKDGSRFLALVSVTALRDEDKAIIGYLLIGTDNTARKAVDAERLRLDQVLQDKNEELQLARVEADKANQAKSDFLSSMSHELRSPLNAILGFAQLMESAVPEPSASQRASIEQILRAGWYLLELINEVLDLSLIESGKLSLSIEPVSVSEILDDCRTLFEPQADKRSIAMRFPLATGVHHVLGDRTRVKQVIINLLSNAIKYNREGGNVLVSCTEVPGMRLRIGVRDTGEGLSADKVVQLFQPFNRLGQEASAGEGTGIGLVVSKRLIELMDGEIGVSSQVGVGSVFWIELPLCEALTLNADDALLLDTPAILPIDAVHVRTLLYIEDNRANMELVEQLVARRPGMRLLGAADGMRGVLLARLHLPDLILMDINLPGISGLHALKILRDDPTTRHIPVLALSANALPRDVERGLNAGFYGYLTKPVKVAEFMLALDGGLKLVDENTNGLERITPHIPSNFAEPIP